jgi:hypothetical protein
MMMSKEGATLGMTILTMVEDSKGEIPVCTMTTDEEHNRRNSEI